MSGSQLLDPSRPPVSAHRIPTSCSSSSPQLANNSNNAGDLLRCRHSSLCDRKKRVSRQAPHFLLLLFTSCSRSCVAPPQFGFPECCQLANSPKAALGDLAIFSIGCSPCSFVPLLPSCTVPNLFLPAQPNLKLNTRTRLYLIRFANSVSF